MDDHTYCLKEEKKKGNQDNVSRNGNQTRYLHDNVRTRFRRKDVGYVGQKVILSIL